MTTTNNSNNNPISEQIEQIEHDLEVAETELENVTSTVDKLEDSETIKEYKKLKEVEEERKSEIIAEETEKIKGYADYVDEQIDKLYLQLTAGTISQNDYDNEVYQLTQGLIIQENNLDSDIVKRLATEGVFDDLRDFQTKVSQKAITSSSDNPIKIYEDSIKKQKDLQDQIEQKKQEKQELETFLINYSFEEQCFLTANIEHIAKESVNYERIKTITHNNLLMLTDTNPFTFITKLTQYPTTKYFFEAQNYELSGIVPMIKLYKVFNDTDEEFQIPFEVNSGVGKWATPVDSLKNRGTRAIGIGIKSFSAKLNGNNPFAVKKSISANLQIYAASFSELAKERTYKNRTFRYLDLALKTGKNPNTNTPNDILNFRLKAVIGWSKPRIYDDFYHSEFIDAIKNSYITLNLTPTIHKFTFDESGAVTFDIEYLSYIDDFFEQPVFNIFSSVAYQEAKTNHNKNIKLLKAKKCSAVSDEHKEKLDKEFDEENKNFQEMISSLKKKTLQEIIRTLSNTQKIFSINLPINDLFVMSKKGFAGYFNNPNNKVEKIQDPKIASVQNDVAKAIATPPTDSDSLNTKTQSSFSPFINIETENVLFFYTRDLFDVILFLLDSKLSNLSSLEADEYERVYSYFKKLKLILGPIQLKDEKGDKKVYNIGSIPISLKSYLSWMTTKVITTEQDEYPFLAFCRSFFNEFIVSQLNDAKCYLAKNTSQRVNLRENFITSYNNLETDIKNNSIVNSTFGDYDITNIRDTTNFKKPYLKVSGPNDSRPSLSNNEEFHYLVFDASESIPNKELKGEYSRNMDSGVFHFISGRQEGIVKQINFTATSATGLAEVRFEQEGYNGLYQLMSVYDVDITTMGMFNMYPGCVIYVDPRGLDPVNTNVKGFDLTNLGIGGYCVVIDVSHQLEAGVCETKIIARWVASKDKSYFNQIIAKENATDVDVSCSNPEGDRQ